MKRTARLLKVNRYLEEFRVPGLDSAPVRVVSSSDATGRLAKLAGDQVLVARAEMHGDGDSDSSRDSVSTAFFVLSKELGPAFTPEAEDRMFRRLEELAAGIVDRLCADTTSGGCRLLAGLSLSSVDVVPENSLFGGWTGYSIDVTLE